MDVTWKRISRICPQTDTEDDHPILRREVEAAVQSLKKGKSAGVDNVPAELVQTGGEDVITALTTISVSYTHLTLPTNAEV